MNTDDQNDLDHPRRRILRRDQDADLDHYREPRGHASGLIAACLVLALAVAGLAWYSYPRFKQQDASIGTLREELRGRVQQLRDESAANSSAHDRLRSEAEKLRQDVRARLDSFSKKTGQAAQNAYDRMEAKLNAEIESRGQGIGALKDRVSNLEASRAADQSQLAELKQELNDLRPPAAVNQSVAADQNTDQSQYDAAGVSQPVEKIPFEASKARQNELTDGITLYVSGTDMTRRSVSGWVWLANEHRRIELHQQNALDPVVFYGAGDGQKRELVITNVAGNLVTGYLLLPLQSNPPSLGQASAAREAGGE